ncbi:MAG: SpoIIE family protein phosphatase [Chloroflexi bacterium]|nr:SpoIIE family protein phosphatase [Chloroflexota bacterium]MDA0242732.1 SpoIIE family protein phosphatase [Chloroflexota bacterium]
MEVHFGMAKASKYATSESGDTFEMVERPHGGLSFVLVDGQRSGKSAKAISNLVCRKAIQLLGEGVRDGAAARAAHDYLYTYRGGKVSATLNIVSVDVESKTFVISRNNEAPVVLYTAEAGITLLDEPSHSIGTGRRTKPLITELPIQLGTLVVVFTDGLRHAGKYNGKETYDYVATIQRLIDAAETNPQFYADTLLAEALALDDGRPRDDVSVFVILAQPTEVENDVRRLSGQMGI